MPHRCAQPLRIEPVTFFIRGPFWRGALLLLNVILSLGAGLGLIGLYFADRDASALWWRIALMVGSPLLHFILLKRFVESKRAHYLEDRLRLLRRSRLSFDHPWPQFFPCLPGLAPLGETRLRFDRPPPRLPRALRHRQAVVRREAAAGVSLINPVLRLGTD